MAHLSLLAPVLLGWALFAHQVQPRQAPPSSVREELFALEEVQLSERNAADVLSPTLAGRPLGTAVLRRTVGGERVQTEWELEFDDGLRVLHVERRDRAGLHLSWRELGAPRPRTLRADWASDAEPGRIVEWSGQQRLLREAPDGAHVRLPLELLEQLRAGTLGDPGIALSLFDPMAATAAQVSLAWTAVAGERRLAELRRGDGTCAGRYLFDPGGELAGMQWQAGTLRARRIDSKEHARLTGPRAEPAR